MGARAQFDDRPLNCIRRTLPRLAGASPSPGSCPPGLACCPEMKRREPDAEISERNEVPRIAENLSPELAILDLTRANAIACWLAIEAHAVPDIALVVCFLVVLPINKLMDRYKPQPQPAPTKDCPSARIRFRRRRRDALNAQLSFCPLGRSSGGRAESCGSVGADHADHAAKVLAERLQGHP